MKTKKQVSSAVELERAFMLGAKWAANRLETSLAAHGMKHDAEITSVRVAERILSERAPDPAPKRKRSSRKQERPAGWAPAAWERYQASLSASTYAALDHKALSARVMTVLDRTEEIRQNPSFSVKLYYAATQPRAGRKRGEMKPGPAADVATALQKLGVSGDKVHFQTAQERDYDARRANLSAYLDALPFDEDSVSSYGRPDTLLSNLQHARVLVLDLLQHGERDDAKDLLRKLRESERVVRERFGYLRGNYVREHGTLRRYGGTARVSDLLRADRRQP